MEENKQQKPWFKKWWGVILTVVLFPVMVPYLVWTRTSWHKALKVAITVVCVFIVIASQIGANENKKQALTLVEQAEEHISEGKIIEALEVISQAKELHSNKSENKAYELEEQIEQYSNFDTKNTLMGMPDSDFELLKSGELKTNFVEHEALNEIILAELLAESDNRAIWITEKEEEERIAQELAAAEERKEMIEEQFSAWDGAHHNLTKAIKDSMNDAKSFEHVETVYWDMDDHLIVLETFRGKNAFGGVVKNSVKAKVALDGTVLEIIEQY